MTLQVFTHPQQPHIRRHWPRGYDPYGAFKPWLRDEFCFRCVYCLEREKWYPDKASSFSVDHVIPQCEAADLICEYSNLVYSCTRCNSIRRHLRLIDPTVHAFGKHIELGSDARFVGLTPEGNDLIDNLRLNKEPALKVRRRMLLVLSLYETMGSDERVRDLYGDVFGFPEDLPDLTTLRPRENLLPDGVLTCFFQRRKAGELPPVY